MTPKLTAEQLNALHASGDQPMPVVDPVTNHIYLVVDPSNPDAAIEALRRSEDLAAIREGLAQMEAGEGTPVGESFNRVRDNLRNEFHCRQPSQSGSGHRTQRGVVGKKPIT